MTHVPPVDAMLLAALMGALGGGRGAGQHVNDTCELATVVALTGAELYTLTAVDGVPNGMSRVRGALNDTARALFDDIQQTSIRQQTAVSRAAGGSPNRTTWARAAVAAHVTPQALTRLLDLRAHLEAQRRVSESHEDAAALGVLEAAVPSALALCMVRPSLAAEVLKHLGLADDPGLRVLGDLETALRAAYRAETRSLDLLRAGLRVARLLLQVRKSIPDEHRHARSYEPLIAAGAPPDTTARHMGARALHAVVLGTYVRCTRVYHALPTDVADAVVPEFFVLPALTVFDADIFTPESLNP